MTSIVVGAGFGDEGKGLVTDWLAEEDPKNTMVVRFSGGQQAGHTVERDGKRHVFSNYASGTLLGCPSYFSEYTCFYLNSIRNEHRELIKKDIHPNLFIHPLAKMTTPSDVAWNQATERENNHGSCGLGIAATFKRHLESPYKLFAVDTKNRKVLVQKLVAIEGYYQEKLRGKSEEFRNYYNQVKRLEERDFIQSLTIPFFDLMNYDQLVDYKHIIFEGSQGIMLDAEHGIFPNVTYSNTTTKNAVEICHILDRIPDIYYVTRCYQTRHGNGWMSNKDNIDLINNEKETNVFNDWQGNFKTGEFDTDLINYALCVDEPYSLGCDKNLVITCLDQRPGWTFNEDVLSTYMSNVYYSHGPQAENIISSYVNT